MSPQAVVPQQVVLLTGASSGIGRATAGLLARWGYQVFGTSRRPADTGASAGAVPGITLLSLDVHAPESIQACVEAVLAKAGRIDVLINNAGAVGPAAASEEIDLAQARALFETNFFGVVAVTNAVLPVMRQQGGGKIINISSVTGKVSAPPFFSFYAASKAALEIYSEGLRYEVRPFNIHVALVEPGYTSTDIGGMIQPPDYPMQIYGESRRNVTRLNRAGIRYGSPAEVVAQTVLRVTQEPRPALRNPCGADSLGILLARQWLPAAWYERLINWMFLGWKPRDETEDIPTPKDLGAHRILFHGPTLTRVLRAALSAVLAGLGLGIGLLWMQRKR